MPKVKLAQMPIVRFPGTICVVESRHEMLNAIRFLRKQPALGLDTETRPNFCKESHYQVSLLQISAKDVCFLFRLNRLGLPAELIELLQDDNIRKIGLSWKDDHQSLCKRKPFVMGKYIELQKTVSDLGIEDRSLQKLYAILFGEKISKRQQLSNWEAKILSPAQQSYAATDAWACLKIWEKLELLKASHDYEIVRQGNLADLLDIVAMSFYQETLRS